MRTVAYGPRPDQVGDLYIPQSIRGPTVCLLHGGFWRMPWGRDNIAPLAVDLALRGRPVWNLEYRRVGTAGGGWPGTLDDVAAGVERLATLAAEGEPIVTGHVTVVGHSAGGHLALWAAARASDAAGHGARVRITAAAGLAPVADLRMAYDLNCGNGAVNDFLGGSPQEHPERYRAASPAALLPLRVRQLLIHGTHDADVPVEISRRYAQAARAAGDDLEFIELAGAAHMDCVDPQSAAHTSLWRWLSAHGESS
jgi:acetyl esterase/lipase